MEYKLTKYELDVLLIVLLTSNSFIDYILSGGGGFDFKL